MKITFISDTHNSKIPIEPTDVLVHAGDLTRRGYKNQIEQALKWLYSLPADKVIFTAGNHDFFIQEQHEDFLDMLVGFDTRLTYLELGSDLFPGSTTYGGVKFTASPWTPWFWNWAYNFPQSDKGRWATHHWNLIPEDTNVLITHGPPSGILDTTKDFRNVGCPELTNKISQLKDLKYHVFGHIHEAYGTYTDPNTNITYMNASIMDFDYNPVNKPITIEYE